MDMLGQASKRGAVRLSFMMVMGLCLLCAASCSRPADCVAEPERCPLQKPSAVTNAKAPAAVVAKALAHKANARKARKVRDSASRKAADEKTVRARILADRELQAEEARLGDLSPGERLHRTPAGLIRRIRNVAANRNLVGLKRFMTKDFVGRVDTMVADSPERFWRHVARYVNAAEHGFELTSTPGPREGTKQLEVKGRGEMTLRPIVERSSRGWLFDRF